MGLIEATLVLVRLLLHRASATSHREIGAKAAPDGVGVGIGLALGTSVVQRFEERRWLSNLTGSS